MADTRRHQHKRGVWIAMGTGFCWLVAGYALCVCSKTEGEAVMDWEAAALRSSLALLGVTVDTCSLERRCQLPPSLPV